MKRMPLIFVIFSFFFLICKSDVQAFMIGSYSDSLQDIIYTDEDKLFLNQMIARYMYQDDLTIVIAGRNKRGLSNNDSDKYNYSVCLTNEENLTYDENYRLTNVTCLKSVNLWCSSWTSSDNKCIAFSYSDTSDHTVYISGNYLMYSYDKPSSSVSGLSIEELAPWFVLVGMCSLLTFLAIMWKRK